MTDLIGLSLGRYHILEQLGEGGMATVYKAYDTRLERDVAVKVIRTEKLTLETMGRTLKRFEREAKALAKLTHPNIVPISDYGEHEGKPYLVMPYLPGGTLKQRLGKPIPWQEALRLLLPVARALEYAHQQGVVHRDVKPSNILITASGEPMLTDFGIAKILLDSEETADLTGTGVGIGTPEYMAPEQFQGKTGPQADIYALAVVLYEMLTGRKPYTADTPAAIIIRQATEPLPRPGQFAPDLPDMVEKVLFKALAKKSEDRYQGMAEFATALERLLKFSPSASRKPGKSKEVRLSSVSEPEVPHSAVNWKTWIIIVASVLLIFSGIMLVSIWMGQNTKIYEPKNTPTRGNQPPEKVTLTPDNTPTVTPTLTNTLTPTPAAPYTYVVQEGDYMGKIIQDHGLGENDLLLILILNPYRGEALENSIDPITQIVYVGQKITLPPPGMLLPTATSIPANAPRGTKIIYFILPGDSLGSIANKFNSTVDEIVKANRALLVDGAATVVYPGWTLIVPINIVTPVPTSRP